MHIKKGNTNCNKDNTGISKKASFRSIIFINFWSERWFQNTKLCYFCYNFWVPSPFLEQIIWCTRRKKSLYIMLKKFKFHYVMLLKCCTCTHSSFFKVLLLQKIIKNKNIMNNFGKIVALVQDVLYICTQFYLKILSSSLYSVASTPKYMLYGAKN